MNNGLYGFNKPPNYATRVLPKNWETILFFISNTSGIIVPDNVYTIGVVCVGGGGSGASSTDGTTISTGGAGGGFAFGVLPVNPGEILPDITIGIGGASVTGQNVGNAGGTTSFGNLISATGGGGGVLTQTLVNGGTGYIHPTLKGFVYSGGAVNGYDRSGGASAGSFYGDGADPGAIGTGGAGLGPNSNGYGGGGPGACGGGGSYSQGYAAGGTASSATKLFAGTGINPTFLNNWTYNVGYDSYGWWNITGLNINPSPATHNTLTAGPGLFKLYINASLDGSASGNAYASYGSSTGYGGTSITAPGPGAGGASASAYTQFSGQSRSAEHGAFGGGGGEAWVNNWDRYGCDGCGNFAYGGWGGVGAGGGSAYARVQNGYNSPIQAYGGNGGILGGGGGSAQATGYAQYGTVYITSKSGQGGRGGVLLMWTEGY